MPRRSLHEIVPERKLNRRKSDAAEKSRDGTRFKPVPNDSESPPITTKRECHATDALLTTLKVLPTVYL